MATTSYGTPYVVSSDLVSGYPGTSLSLADRVDDISFKGNGINDQTGTTYTLDILDAGKTVTFDNASPVAVTIPTNTAEAIEIGSIIRLVNKGAGLVTIQPDATVTLSGGNLRLPQFGAIQIVKLATNTWGRVANATNKIGQILSTTKTDVFSTTSTAYVDLTGLSVSITPQNTSSSIYVTYDIGWDPDNNIICYAQLVRDSTAVGGGTAAGSRRSANKSTFFNTSSAKATLGLAGSFLDTPATASAVTYKIQVAVNSGTLHVNRTLDDSDATHYVRTSSTITVMEVLP